MSRCILIIEDDVAIRDALAEILTDEGYPTLGAAHGREALDILEAGERPGLILLDLMMPVMDGWEFVSRLRQCVETAHIPVIVFTADGHAREKAERVQAQGYLLKPPSLEQVLATVKEFIGESAKSGTGSTHLTR